MDERRAVDPIDMVDGQPTSTVSAPSPVPPVNRDRCAEIDGTAMTAPSDRT
jgi:hypothetical protein